MLMNKVLAGHQYVANFLDAPVGIGMIYRMDDNQFIPAIRFSDVFPEVDLNKYIDSGTKGDIRFSAASNVTVTFGASATTNIGESAVKFKFLKKKTVAGVIGNAAVDSLRFHNVLEQLKKLWTDKGYMKYRKEYLFVYEIVTAASGTLIYSEESNNEVVLKHKFGAGVTKFADLASGDFEYVSNTKRTLEIIRNVAHKPLFKAFRFTKDWQPEVLG